MTGFCVLTLLAANFELRTPLGRTGAESSGDAAAARALKFKPKKVTDEMVRLLLFIFVQWTSASDWRMAEYTQTNQICGMFPDIPR